MFGQGKLRSTWMEYRLLSKEIHWKWQHLLKQGFGENVAKDYRSAAQQRAVNKELLAHHLNFFVAITYGEEGIFCESYDHLTGLFFARLIEKHFYSLFVKANKNGSRLWLEDGDPSQNSRDAKKAMWNCNCDLSLT